MTVSEQTKAEDLVATKRAGTNGRAAAEPIPVASSVSFVTADELGAEISGQQVALTAEQQARVDAWTASYRRDLVATTEQALEREAALEEEEERAPDGAALGTPTIRNYVAYDIVSASPLQFIGNPPFRPHKIVAGGDLMMLQALQWINPRVSIRNGFAIPPTTQLSGRHLRVRFDQLNLTKGIAGPSFAINIKNLPTPAPTFILFRLYLVAPAVSDAELYEVNVTSDIVGMGQPYAAFATWHQDRDADLPWLAPAPANFPPAVRPRMLHNAAMRYMVYNR